MTEGAAPTSPGADAGSQETVGELSQLYLGNILYALELSALSLEEQEKPGDAAFYRGIARKLAEARGRERSRGTDLAPGVTDNK